jgi:glycosyltransferase involved in cell wall biosynthesis
MAYLAACDVFCLPSWSEGFGIVYLEAMAHGKPVIAVQGQGIAEVLAGRDAGILVPPRDAAAVTGALAMLLGDPQAAREMGARGRKLVEEEFSLEKWVGKTVALCEQVVADWGQRSPGGR